MPNNYILLETIALTQSAASVTFDNLPTSGYTDLKIVMSIRSDSTDLDTLISFNGSTASFSAKRLYGSGSTAASDSLSRTAGLVNMSSYTASTFANNEIYIPNYRGSTNKSYSVDSVTENNATAAYALFAAGLWSNTAAITSISIAPSLGNFVANSTFSLYGIAALGTTPVLAPKATGGNIVANDGTYWYHAFLSSGNFVPQTGLTADLLVVAGGGGSGFNYAGGGGAGGLLAFTSQALTATSYNVTVGAGGSAGTSMGVRGTNGVDSQFASLTLVKGGGAGGASEGSSQRTGVTGGSGGGGGGADATSGYTATNAGGSPTTSQGFAGGAGRGISGFGSVGGGGGGAGAVGQDAPSSPFSAGNGGVGSTAYSSWGLATGTGQNVSGTVYYAGGGGGGAYGGPAVGTGGLGGGGVGVLGTVGTAGTANTGGGAGGSGSGSAGGAGGSGVVIIRYPIA